MKTGGHMDVIKQLFQVSRKTLCKLVRILQKLLLARPNFTEVEHYLNEIAVHEPTLHFQKKKNKIMLTTDRFH